MTPYETLRSKINAVRPPKLEFGCEIKTGEGIVRLNVVSDGNGLRGCLDLNGDSYYISRESLAYDRTIEILGLPVSLADVLMLMDKKHLFYSLSQKGMLRVRRYPDNPFRGETMEKLDRLDVRLDLSKPVGGWGDEILSKILELV